MSKIILNADDFGKSPVRNRAIIDSVKNGLVSSIGLIVTSKYLQDAVSQYENAEGNFEIVHLHFNLSTNLLHEGSDDTALSESMKHNSFFCQDGKFIKYHGLHSKFRDVKKWKVVYEELVAQYNKFKEVTNGKADYKHVDFHLWYNLTWPVAVALNLFTWRYNIKSVRYIGVHQMGTRKFRLLRTISWNPFVNTIPATNIDYYLSKKHLFNDDRTIELYCHPHYKDGVLLDDTPSYLKHERQPLPKQIERLKELGEVEFISWESVL